MADTVTSMGLPAREGRELRRDQHGRHVARTELLARDVDAQPLEDVAHDLLGEGGVSQAVPRAVEPDHEAIAHEVVGAYAVELHEIL